jgi:hypothetical protein
MRIKETTAVLMALMGMGDVYASANLAKIPVSVRQTYQDGTATELSCGPHSHCTFIVYGKRNQRLSLAPEYSGYPTSGFLTDYSYWPNSGHNLNIATNVECQKADLELVTDTEPTCRMFLERTGKTFTAIRIEVWPREGVPGYHYLGSAP